MTLQDVSLIPEDGDLLAPQRKLVERPVGSKIFLEGPAGTGKTTTGVARLHHYLDSGVSGHSILILTPQRTLGTPYYEAVHSPGIDAGGEVTLLTIGGLAQRMVDLFWPLIVEEAGFAHPDEPPTFLTLETAQYTMARLVGPLLDEGYFESVTIDRNRLYSQIIDNLNKAAVVGFPYTEIGQRLKSAWGGEQSRERVYEQAQVCASRFRRTCLEHNLLDFSLQVDVFLKHLWTRPICRDYLMDRYEHLFVDNVEEDVPVAHDLLREWISSAESAFLISDHEAGYRRFLGADPEGAYTLRDLCDETVTFEESLVMVPELTALSNALSRSMGRLPSSSGGSGDIRRALTYEHRRYHPEMLDWVAAEIEELVKDRNVPPGEIVVLAPFLSDALRFSLANRLAEKGIPSRSHRPSRALREEPATHCLLTLAAIAHPEWKITPARFDVAYALMQAIEGMDLVRAQLLAEIVYRVKDGVPTLSSFDHIRSDMQERLTYVLGERYEGLRRWIEAYVNSPSRQSARRPSAPQGEGASEAPSDEAASGADMEDQPFDHFLSRLFGEVLSQPGYGFHRDYDSAEVAANLVESVRKFRWTTEGTRFSEDHPISLGEEYIRMVEDGVIAAQYIRSWQLEPEDAVLLAPAYTFIIRNRPVDYQFWLNVGGRGWWERLYQPLTHPYVLSRHWPPPGREDATWTDSDEVEAREEALYRLSKGLIRRCRRKVYLGLSELGEQGYEQKGPLLQAIQRVLRQLPAEPTE
jgi:hypothetical protein